MHSAVFYAANQALAVDSIGAANPEDPPPSLTREAVLDAAEPLRGVHAIVVSRVGTVGLDMLCGLIHRGCDAATELTPDGRVPSEPVELAIFPAITSLDSAQRALQIAARGLLPCGRIVLQASSSALVPHITRLLHHAGFSTVRSQIVGAGAVLSANWPMFGHHAWEAGRA